jgi:hypothetical protein
MAEAKESGASPEATSVEPTGAADLPTGWMYRQRRIVIPPVCIAQNAAHHGLTRVLHVPQHVQRPRWPGRRWEDGCDASGQYDEFPNARLAIGMTVLRVGDHRTSRCTSPIV